MAPTRLRSQTTITQPGTYTLAHDTRNGGGTRLSESYIRIEADDVVLDGNGATIGGGGVSDTSGIVVSQARNVTLRNVILERWDYGIRFENVTGGQVRNVRVRNNGYGLSFTDTDLAVVRQSRITRNVLGVIIEPSSTVFLWDNSVENNLGRDVYRPRKQDG